MESGQTDDLLSIGVKYSIEMDSIGLDIAYVNQTGNAGQDGGNNYNDLDETAYSANFLW